MVDSTGDRSDPLRGTPQREAKCTEIVDAECMRPAEVSLRRMIIVEGVVLVSLVSAALLVVLM